MTRQKVTIGSISISEVANQYLAEVERMEDLDLDVASDFVLVASTLLDIKAASLVPAEPVSRNADVEDEDDADLEGLSPDEAREVLIARLIAYKQFRSAGAALGARLEAEGRMLPRTVGPDPEFLNLMPDYLEGISLRSLAVICADIDSHRETFLLEARASRQAPASGPHRGLRGPPGARHGGTLAQSAPGRRHTPEVVVVNFLTILDLFKRGMVTVRQDKLFGDIEITHIEGADAYELDESVLAELDEADAEAFGKDE